jgi:hypothetical protein
MNFLQLTNEVLKRMRETSVASVTENAYSTLIGSFVNEAKREVEDAWTWKQLRDTIQVNTVASTWEYTLTGAGNRYKILQVINDTSNYELQLGDYYQMNLLFTTGTSSSAQPIMYDINGSSGGDPIVNLWPIPDAAYVINFNMKIPQDDLTGTTDLTVPDWPVILGATTKALIERGEDNSNTLNEYMNRYHQALADAIAIDAAGVPNELYWRVV